MSPRVAVLPGDGIGPEVIQAALAHHAAGLETVSIDAGAERYLATGELLTRDDLEVIEGCDAILFGAVGDQRVADGVLERGILLRLRTELDLYVNLRPFPELDIVLVRENTEGLYAGLGWRAQEAAWEASVNTPHAISRTVRFAFEQAERRSRYLTWVHKTNVLTYAGDLWRMIIEAVAGDHPNVTVSYEHVDAAAYHVVTDPGRFDVIVTDNLFGDILSDVAAGVAGGIGRAASANLNLDLTTRRGQCIGLFEPIHGSAPDIAGTGTADSTGAVRALEMLLEWVSSHPPSHH